MDIHTIEVYLGLCRNLHFGRTSEEFHMSPSALSRLIQKLENTVGHQLLVRDNRSVSLTEQGLLLRQFALETQSNWGKLMSELSATDDILSGKLTLFATVTASQSILPNVLKRFRQDYPGIQIQLETGYAENAMQRLRDGVDVVVAALDSGENDKLSKKIITSMPIITVAAKSEDAQTDHSDSDWSDVPLILPATGQVRDNIDDWFRKQHIRPKIYSEVAGNEAILSLVALGCGVGFVPQLVLENSPLGKQLTLLNNAPALSNFHVGFCVQKKSLLSSRLIQAFWHSI